MDFLVGRWHEGSSTRLVRLGSSLGFTKQTKKIDKFNHWVAIGAIRISNFGIRCKTLTARSSTGNDSLRLLPELCDRSRKVVARKISSSESGSEVAKEC